MKKSIKSGKIIIGFIFLLAAQTAFSQSAWVKAYNVNSYYYTDPGCVYTWSGSVVNGYCHGYGTIQWYQNGRALGKYTGYIQYGKNGGIGTQYYSNGNKYYEGNWQNDMKNGFGTLYNSDGTILFKGYFINDAIKNKAELENISQEITEYIVENIFDGGTNVKYDILRAIYLQDNSLVELRIKITFNGNIVTTNYYEGTLIIKNNDAYFTNCNDRFNGYITGKQVGQLIIALLESDD